MHEMKLRYHIQLDVIALCHIIRQTAQLVLCIGKLQLVHPGRSNLQAMVLLPTIGFDVSAIDLDYLDRVVGTNKGR